MKNDLFQIGPVVVHGYGLMIAIGVLCAYLVGEYRAKKLKLDPDHLFYLTICGLVGGIIGAKLLFYIVEIKSIIANPKLLLDVLHGFVVYGGIVGGIISGYLYCRIKKIEFLQYFDLIMPSIALAQAFGRIGCLLAGCCYGRETDSAFHIVFHDSDFAPNGVQLVPTQVMSSLFNFANFFVLVFLAKKLKAKGQVAALYLFFYSIGRFFIEFFRNDPRGSVNVLSTSQFISLFILAGGLILFILCGKFAKKKPVVEEEKVEEAIDQK